MIDHETLPQCSTVTGTIHWDLDFDQSGSNRPDRTMVENGIGSDRQMLLIPSINHWLLLTIRPQKVTKARAPTGLLHISEAFKVVITYTQGHQDTRDYEVVSLEEMINLQTEPVHSLRVQSDGKVIGRLIDND